MIFYFSGTGNTQYIAQRVAQKNNDRLISIAEAIKINQWEYHLGDNESIGFSFPVYFWGVPAIVVDFLKQLKLHNYTDNYIYALSTAGGNIGACFAMFNQLLKKRGWQLDSGFNIQMPDNYIILLNLLTPPEQVAHILEQAKEQVETISPMIANKEKKVFIQQKEFAAALRTAICYPIYKYGRKTKPFRATSLCNGCGLCAKICPCCIISMQNDLPVWIGKRCTQCLGCLHRCPQQAIEYGKKSVNRGRYRFDAEVKIFGD